VHARAGAPRLGSAAAALSGAGDRGPRDRRDRDHRAGRRLRRRPIETRAVADGDHYVVNGLKSYITNGGVADFVVTLCRTADEDPRHSLSLLVVPADAPGLGIRASYPKLGNLCCSHAELVYDHVRVPRDHLIGREGMGFEIQSGQFQRERLILGIIGASQSRWLLDLARSHAERRTAFGLPLAAHQRIAFALADLETEVELLRHFGYYCASLFAAGREPEREIAMLKLKASRVVRQVADECLQVFAGQGYMEDVRVSRAYRDVRAAAIAGGTDEMMQRIVVG